MDEYRRMWLDRNFFGPSRAKIFVYAGIFALMLILTIIFWDTLMNPNPDAPPMELYQIESVEDMMFFILDNDGILTTFGLAGYSQDELRQTLLTPGLARYEYMWLLDDLTITDQETRLLFANFFHMNDLIFEIMVWVLGQY